MKQVFSGENDGCKWIKLNQVVVSERFPPEEIRFGFAKPIWTWVSVIYVQNVYCYCVILFYYFFAFLG